VAELDLTRWDAPGPYEVAFSNRTGGVSDGAYASLNLGLLSGDDRELVQENRSRLYDAAGAHPERISWPRQVHGAAVVRAGSRGEEADAIWTDEAREPVMVVTADCVPVALARIGGRPGVALAHVGWRGLLAGVVAAAVDALGGRVVAAAIGPGIGPCCYEVGKDVADPVRAAFGVAVVRDGHLDLPEAVERALIDAGCVRVDRLGECTSCHSDRYFSHRRDHGLTGRQGAIAYVA
jgi:purine-nucleoside/S-methyl-5'-thioadenosine phosphorylase / adenosine deaminase